MGISPWFVISAIISIESGLSHVYIDYLLVMNVPKLTIQLYDQHYIPAPQLQVIQ